LYSFYLLRRNANDLGHNRIPYGGCTSLALKRVFLLAPLPGPLFVHVLSFSQNKAYDQVLCR
jgi:hypothetical protein